MTKNERILCVIITTLIDKSQKYIKADFVIFPNREIGHVKKAITYLEKILEHYGNITFAHSELRTAINRISGQILKINSGGKHLDIPKEDFDYIALMDLISMQFDEILERQKLPATVKTNLKTANTYLKKFFEFIQKELN